MRDGRNRFYDDRGLAGPQGWGDSGWQSVRTLAGRTSEQSSETGAFCAGSGSEWTTDRPSRYSLIVLSARLPGFFTAIEPFWLTRVHVACTRMITKQKEIQTHF